MGDPAILDHVGFRSGKHEFSAGDVHLSAAEIHRVQTVLHRCDNFLRVLVAVQHVGVGHARHGQMRKGFTACVARYRHAHQPRVECVLQITFEDTVLDQRGALRGIAFVVHLQRASTSCQRAVIHHCHAFRRDALADTAGKRRAALAIEVAFQAVPDRFVQQDARPAVAQHHGHVTCRCRRRIEIGHRLMHGLLCIPVQHRIVEIAVVEASAPARGSLFPLAVALDNDRHRQAYQRPYVGIHQAVIARHHHHLIFAGQASHHLHHTRIDCTSIAFHPFQQCDFFRVLEGGDRIIRQIDLAARTTMQHRHGLCAALPCNCARCLRGAVQRIQADVVGIGEGGLLAAHCAHPDTLIYVETAGLDDALFQ